MTRVTVKNLLKRSGFKKTNHLAKVSQVITKLQSTHDAVFVFQEDRFLGLVNLYHSFLGKKFNPEEKVANCLFHPPVISPKTFLPEVARLMVESRVYRLPVMEKGRFLGVVFAEDLLVWAKKQAFFRFSLEEKLKFRPSIFVDLSTPISQALHLMVENNINRLLVADKNGNLVGILTLYDLRQAFAKPQERISFLMRAPIKEEFARQPVRKFYHRQLISIIGDKNLAAAVDLMLTNNIGSLVVFSRQNSKKPLGLATFRDLLQQIEALNQKRSTATLSQQFKEKSLRLAKIAAVDKINKLLKSNSLFVHKIKEINLDIREIAKGRPEVRLPLMEVTALVRLTDGNRLLRSKVKGRRLAFMVDELLEKIRTLLRKQKQ